MTVSHRRTSMTWLMNHSNLVENKNLTVVKDGFGFYPPQLLETGAKSLTKRNRIRLDIFSFL